MIRKIYQTQPKAMKEVELYQKTNLITRIDSSKALEEYFFKIKWKEQNAKILDIGCADGAVTIQVLKSYLPENFEKLEGCDISEEMVAIAKKYHEDDKIKFTVMDIAGDTTQLLGQFDHIFSFYTLHWIQGQEKALSNIYSMLAPGGDCLLLFSCHNPIFNVYRVMASSSTWSQYMFDVENYIPPYHDSQNPVEEYTNLMIKCGFKNVEVQCKKNEFIYKHSDTLKSTLIHPNIQRLPPALQEQFMEDSMQELMKQDGISKMSSNNGENEEIKLVYTLLLAYASK